VNEEDAIYTDPVIVASLFKSAYVQWGRGRNGQYISHRSVSVW